MSPWYCNWRDESVWERATARTGRPQTLMHPVYRLDRFREPLDLLHKFQQVRSLNLVAFVCREIEGDALGLTRLHIFGMLHTAETPRFLHDGRGPSLSNFDLDYLQLCLSMQHWKVSKTFACEG